MSFSKTRKFLFCIAFSICLQAVRSFAGNIIASQEASSSTEPSWFDGIETWFVTTDVVPASPSIPADASARTMVFGSPLQFSIFPVNPTSSFVVQCTFLDDGGNRVQSLTVGDKVISPSFPLTPKKIYTVEFNVSSDAVKPSPTTGQSSLLFSFGALAGPNAILSSFALSSSNPNDPPISPPKPQVPTHDLPRLTLQPESITGYDSLLMDLNPGPWFINPNPSMIMLDKLLTGKPSEIQAGLSSSDMTWNDILVPGEYTLQGYRVPSGQPVLYTTSFILPSSWDTSLQKKIRFDGIYSNGTVFVNGELVGRHVGGFTPFELDITNAVLGGGVSNNLTVVVVSASLADTLASGSQYATHDLGGITRKVYIMAVPSLNLADVHVITSFDSSYTTSNLFLNVSVANDGLSATTAPLFVQIELSYNGVKEAVGSVSFAPPILNGTVAFSSVNLSVSNPPLWDPEHPRLHNLTFTLNSERVLRRIGFRDVKVVGNRIVINGQPVKARGTTRHETHPLFGRSLWNIEPKGLQWERDIIMFRDANINYIRTSHYPPAEELMIAADELGMLIELEMPFCWASGNSGGEDFNYTVQAQREAMVFLRNHPSIIHWSLGNESPWLTNFDSSLKDYLREIDDTRPFMFDGGSQQPIPPLNILSVHYPSFDGPGEYANATQPTLFGEYAHLNCYNRRELAADPGVRDIWGIGIEHMWELIYASPGVLGACYWAGIDDIFYMPGGLPVGYGYWGVIDAWRREKPETFLVRNIYAPVKLSIPIPGSTWAPTLPVENRHDFSSLDEMSFSWQILDSAFSGVGQATGAPHSSSGSLTFAGLPSDLTGIMQVNATSPRGFIINSWTFPLSPQPSLSEARVFPVNSGGSVPSVQELPDGRILVQDSAGAFSWFISLDGNITGNTTTSAGPVLSSGPTLMVLAINSEGATQITEDMPPITPFTDPLFGWTISTRNFSVVGDVVQVIVSGVYPQQAQGVFTYSFDGSAQVQVDYDFSWISATSIQPRQMGLVFNLPNDLNLLSWTRTTPWQASYPADHIGRAVGVSVSSNVGPLPGNTTPTTSWNLDQSPLGDNDFRSTKHNVTLFSLASGTSSERRLSFLSNGTQHGRTWIDENGSVNLLAADVSMEGGNPFSRERVLPSPTYNTGSSIKGSVLLKMN
jgi:hypothetical protein